MFFFNLKKKKKRYDGKKPRNGNVCICNGVHDMMTAVTSSFLFRASARNGSRWNTDGAFLLAVVGPIHLGPINQVIS